MLQGKAKLNAVITKSIDKMDQELRFFSRPSLHLMYYYVQKKKKNQSADLLKKSINNEMQD